MFLFYLLLATVSGIAISALYPGWRDKRILEKPFPARWQAIVDRRIPFYPRLGSDTQIQLQNRIKLFVAKKKFFGCGGQEMTEEIRITIAAEACLLLLNRNIEVYPDLHYILVYPSAFVAEDLQYNPDGTVRRVKTGLLGQSWRTGKVVLSWKDADSGIKNFHDGHNVILHEFAHQLDGESGYSNGAPVLRNNSYQTWAKVFSHEFATLNKTKDRPFKAAMNYYGATSPAEFFAVATETFFEKPEQMHRKHPELFMELKTYYCVDPRQWQ